MNLIQIMMVVFVLFALSRVILRFKGGNVSILGLVFWTAIFSSAVIFIIYPALTGRVAMFLGIGRGVDAIVYGSVVILFYLVFRLYVNLENTRHEISDLVRKLAIKDHEEKQKKQHKN